MNNIESILELLGFRLTKYDAVFLRDEIISLKTLNKGRINRVILIFPNTIEESILDSIAKKAQIFVILDSNNLSEFYAKYAICFILKKNLLDKLA